MSFFFGGRGGGEEVTPAYKFYVETNKLSDT
jgi:hypothetical protein